MKQTVLQQVFSELERLYPSLFDIHTEKGRTFVNQFHKFIAMEKEQMKALYTMHMVDTRTMELYDFDEYYNETFKPE